MQIVINISEETFNNIKERAWLQPREKHRMTLEQIIANGTVLPKHGRLIDADAQKDEWKEGFHKKIVDALMDDAPTILEATK